MTLPAKRSLWMALSVFLVIGAIAAWKILTVRAIIAKMSQQKPPLTVVSSTKATEEIWQRRLHAVGSFAASEGITVTNELDGAVTQIAFASGAPVQQGELLVQLDVSAERAQLANAVAGADLARINLRRAQELRAKDTNSQAELDLGEAQARQTAATADALRAVIAKKTIRAPFTGRTGIRQINLGQFLKGGTAIVTLQALDPLFFNFYLPQQDVTHLTVGQVVQITVDAYPGVVFAGEITAINPKVEETSRNLLVQATVRNQDERLRPGMFAALDVVLPRQDKLVTLPLTAISYNPYGNSVYVVENKGRDASGQPVLVVRQQFVQLGSQRGDQVAVLKGVNAGDEVVTAGQLKLRNGSSVQLNNTVEQTNSLRPNLPNT
ncbi:MAG: efflux RND transporter periplasmic adaptor subunit [Opitutales bacterium]|nr:efflux RND transporter periplasmic adaptor subunit [Opitutales bacterium]